MIDVPLSLSVLPPCLCQSACVCACVCVCVCVCVRACVCVCERSSQLCPGRLLSVLTVYLGSF